MCRIFADAAEDPDACVKVLCVPDGKRLSNARLKPKGDVFGEPESFSASSTIFPCVCELRELGQCHTHLQ